MIILLLLIQSDTLRLSLDEALDRARGNSPSAMSARVDRVQAGISLGRGVAALLPTPHASVNRTTTGTGPESRTVWNGSVGMNQIADIGLIPGLIQAAHLNRYYRLQSGDKTNRLRFEVTSGYYAVIKAYGLVEASVQAQKQAYESVRLLEEKYRLGQVSKIDLLRAQVFASQAEINLGSADQGLQAANEDLKATIGMREPGLIKPTEVLTAPAEMAALDPDSLVLIVQKRNPALAASIEFERQARVGIATAASRILPSVSLFSQSGYSDSAFPGSPGQWRDHALPSRGIGISFPIFDIKTILVNVADARNGAKSARVGRRTAEFGIEKALRQAVIGFNEAKVRAASAKKNLELSEEVERLGLEQSRLGTLSLIDLLDVETKLTQARTQYLSALCDTYIGRAQLEYLTGGNP